MPHITSIEIRLYWTQNIQLISENAWKGSENSKYDRYVRVFGKEAEGDRNGKAVIL